MHKGQSRYRMGPVTLGCSLARVSRECVMEGEARAYGRGGQAGGASRLPHREIERPILTRALAPEPISRTSSRTGVPRLGGCIGGGHGG